MSKYQPQSKHLKVILIVSGWATLIAYAVNNLIIHNVRIDNARQLGADSTLISELSAVYIVAAIFESPLTIAIGFLCFAAAYYLNNQETPTLEIFE